MSRRHQVEMLWECARLCIRIGDDAGAKLYLKEAWRRQTFLRRDGTPVCPD